MDKLLLCEICNERTWAEDESIVLSLTIHRATVAECAGGLVL
jgi:hypothetical protein